MKQKVTLIGLALIGLVFLFSGSALANGNYRHGHHYAKRIPHYGYHAPKGPGWHRGPGYHPQRFHRGPWYRSRHHRPVHRTVEKHVYHHYDSNAYDDRDDQYQAAGSVSDPFFSFSFGISGSR
jgi:hypothetical protein